MNATEQYAKKSLKTEIKDVENSPRNIELPELTVYEKALIYKYSHDGYEKLNETLRDSQGAEMNEFGKLLLLALNKLPNFTGLVYRCVDLSPDKLNRYLSAYIENKPIKEYAFLSTSKSKKIAGQYGNGTLFLIFSRTGKDIEKIAKFGIHNAAPNEREVLFKPNRSFRILEITKEDGKVTITMEEL